MRFFLRRGATSWGPAWLLAFFFFALGGLRPEVAHATHLRAGDIQAKVDTITGNPNHIFFRLTLYRNSGGAPQNSVTIYFGDGTRTDNIPKVSEVPLSGDTNVLVFNFDHFYSGAGKYVVSFVGENRVGGVINMFNSIGQTFYINSSITINPAYGRNHSPVLRAPAIDKAAIGQVFLHNPAGYDADGDSLAYHLRPSQQVAGGTDVANVNNTPNPVDCTSFIYPNDQNLQPRGVQVPYAGMPIGKAGDAAIFVQDPITGQLTWNAPSQAGVYNVAFVVEEWRRTANGRILIGTVIRDMQINVTATTNLPPTLTVPADVCVVAGTPVTLRVAATDGAGTGNQGSPTALTLFAYSGILPPATFTQTTTGSSVAGTFNWTPDCSNVSNQPYIVVFKVQDSPPATSGAPILIDEKPVRITVVGPPPQNVRVVASTATTLTGLVSWDRYPCQNASRLLIFRREGSYPFTPGPCQTGLPAGSGYVQVGSVLPGVTTFADDNAGQGLSRGKQYCYRVYAVFPLPAGGVSLVSNEDCLAFSGRSARLTNVDVNATSPTTGQITVKWTRPRPNTGTFTAPFGYRLGRAVGTSTAFAPVATITSLSDTTFVDTNLNTAANQYTYQLTFFSSNTSSGAPVEQTEIATPASSVRTSLVPDGLNNRVAVSWAYNVPWDNTKQPATIYRQDPGSPTYAAIGTAPTGAAGGTYTDADPRLQRGQTYCYYVQTNGQYPDLSFLNNLLNKSQQVCTVLQATPCTPVLSIRPVNCDSLAALPSFPADNQRYQNNLRWTVSSAPTGCSTAAAYYRILRSNSQTGIYVAIDSTTRLDYADRFLVKSSYCYVVQAVSAQGIRSALSNAACQDECAFFLLPNIFTPNGDGKNDVFRPKTASTVLRTRIQVFNRWGRKVYESDQDPYINWTGAAAGEGNTNGLVSGGLYYYLAEVQFADANNTRRTFKGWVEVVR